MENLRVKVAFESDKRRFQIPQPASYAKLEEVVSKTFKMQPSMFAITYEDDEKEMVTLGNDYDLLEAIDVMKDLNSKTLKIFVSKVKGIVDPKVEKKENETVSKPKSSPKPKKVEKPKLTLNEAQRIVGQIFKEFTSDEESMKVALKDAVSLLTNVKEYKEVSLGLYNIAKANKALNFVENKDKSEKVMKCVEKLCEVAHLVEGGELFNFGHDHLLFLLEIGFPISRPFKFEKLVKTFIDLISVQNMPKRWNHIVKCVIDVVKRVTIPEEVTVAPKRSEHTNYTCDGCGVGPIVGPRFHCSSCVDYDLCQSCEDKGVHNRSHIMVKHKVSVKTAPLAKVWKNGALNVSCLYEDLPAKKQEKSKDPKNVKGSKKQKKPKAAKQESKEQILVKESEWKKPKTKKSKYPGFKVLGSRNGEIVANRLDIVFHTWKIKNTRDVEWPLGTTLCFLSGSRDILIEEAFEVEHCKFGETGLLRAAFKVPHYRGQFSATFGMKTPDGKRFGQTVSITITAK